MKTLILLTVSAFAFFYLLILKMANSRQDKDLGVDRDNFVVGYGHLFGYPTRPGVTSTATTGVPTNGVAGFAKGAQFINFLGTTGSLLYVNTGTNTSATWSNVI